MAFAGASVLATDTVKRDGTMVPTTVFAASCPRLPSVSLCAKSRSVTAVLDGASTKACRPAVAVSWTTCCTATIPRSASIARSLSCCELSPLARRGVVSTAAISPLAPTSTSATRFRLSVWLLLNAIDNAEEASTNTLFMLSVLDKSRGSKSMLGDNAEAS